MTGNPTLPENYTLKAVTNRNFDWFRQPKTGRLTQGWRLCMLQSKALGGVSVRPVEALASWQGLTTVGTLSQNFAMYLEQRTIPTTLARFNKYTRAVLSLSLPNRASSVRGRLNACCCVLSGS